MVDPSTFVIVPAELDPFETGTSTTGRCPVSETVVEEYGGETTFSIYTRSCSRLTVEAPISEAVAPGETARLRIYQFAQILPAEETEAEVLVALEDQVVYSKIIPLPADSQLLVGDIAMENGIAAGTPVRWHISNHGINSWNFVALEVTRDLECPPE